MAKNSQVYLQDMLEALERIEAYSLGVSREQLLADYMRQDAIIRQMEILGEAANHLPESFLDQYPEFPAREAAVMRNFLIHDYDTVDIETVWKTLLDDLPTLKKNILKILG